LEENAALHDVVNSGLEQKWSPKQISRRLREDFPEDDTMRVSHETIYEFLYLQARGELRTQLTITLRQGRTCRVSRSRATVTKGKIRDMINISEHPVEAEDRAVPGFWEGDLVRHEALCFRVEVKGRCCVVRSGGRLDPFPVV
jgi:IS30 family transposase